MPISKNYRPTTPQYTSQLTEDSTPYDEIMQVGAQKQRQLDQLRGVAAETGKKLQIKKDPRLSGSYNLARKLEEGYNQRLEQGMNEFYETGNTRKALRNIQELQQKWQNDPYRKQIEMQTDRFQEDVERARKLREEGRVVNRWQQNGQYVSGLTDSGVYIPQQGVMKGLTDKDERTYLEDMMDIPQQRKEGKEYAVNKNNLNTIFRQAGITINDPRNSDKWEVDNEKLNRFKKEFGVGRVMDQVANSIGKDIDEVTDKDVKDYYKRRAANVANTIFDKDIYKTSGRDDKDEGAGFTVSSFTDNIMFTNNEALKTGNITSENNAIALVTLHGIPQLGEPIEDDDTKEYIKEINSSLAKSGYLRKDINETFKEYPLMNNSYKMIENILNMSEKERVNSEMDEEQIFESLTGKNLSEVDKMDYLKKLKNVEKELGKKYAKKSVDKNKVDGKAINLTGDMQTELSKYNFSDLPVLDAVKGLPLSESYPKNLNVKRIVEMPISYKDGKWNKSKDNNLFIEASGIINTDNMTEETRRMYRKLYSGIQGEGQMIPEQSSMDGEKIESDKLLIPINDQTYPSIRAALNEFPELVEHIDKTYGLNWSKPPEQNKREALK